MEVTFGHIVFLSFVYVLMNTEGIEPHDNVVCELFISVILRIQIINKKYTVTSESDRDSGRELTR